MRITIINHSDTRGGAAVASIRMLEALRAEGVDARMLVMHKATHSPYVQLVEPTWRRKACFLAEHLDIFLHNGLSRAKLFQASTAKYGMPLSQHPWVQDADCVLLGWINQGMLSLKEIARIKAPIAWVMHDMWCATGICHHAGACQKYLKLCDYCRLLHGADDAMRAVHDLSYATWQRKRQLYGIKPILFIAVSNWLSARCRQSELMRDQRIATIPNAFPVDQYIATQPKAHSVSTIVMGAARLDDPIKGLPLAIEALNILHRKGIKAKAVFFGALKDAHALDGLELPYEHLGPLHSSQEICRVYASADVVLSSSHYETLPTTLIEGMATGCVPVTYGQGGQSDIVDHLHTGYIAQYPSVQDLACGIEWAIGGNVDRQCLPLVITERFSAQSVTQRLIAAIKAHINQLKS